MAGGVVERGWGRGRWDQNRAHGGNAVKGRRGGYGREWCVGLDDVRNEMSLATGGDVRTRAHGVPTTPGLPTPSRTHPPHLTTCPIEEQTAGVAKDARRVKRRLERSRGVWKMRFALAAAAAAASVGRGTERPRRLLGG